MKKTLIAIAAIAAMGAASAQVTVYGKVDLGASNTSADGTKVGLNGWETSRFGVKASETAAGLTLSAQLEGKLRDDSSAGQAGFKGFDRTATVGVAGSFGAITIGNQWTPFDNAVWTTDALEYNGFTPLAGGIWNYDVGNTGMGNAKNSIQYATPDMNGLQAFVLTASNVAANTQGAKNYTGLGVNYVKGPLVINFATQSYNGKYVGAAEVTTATISSNVLAINYNIGAATLYGGLVNTTDDVAGSKDSGVTAGVKVPLGADSVSLGYASNKTSLNGKDSTIGAWGAQYIKSLSKAAVAYFGVQSVDSVNKTGAGVRYNF